MINHILDINETTFRVAGYPREDESRKATKPPIAETWRSPFIGWSPKQCAEYLWPISRRENLDNDFAIVDDELKAKGLLQLCRLVDEEDVEDWKECHDWDDYEEDEKPEVPFGVGLKCFPCEAGYAFKLGIMGYVGMDWLWYICDEVGFPSEPDPDFYARAEVEGAMAQLKFEDNKD